MTEAPLQVRCYESNQIGLTRRLLCTLNGAAFRFDYDLWSQRPSRLRLDDVFIGRVTGHAANRAGCFVDLGQERTGHLSVKSKLPNEGDKVCVRIKSEARHDKLAQLVLDNSEQASDHDNLGRVKERRSDPFFDGIEVVEEGNGPEASDLINDVTDMLIAGRMPISGGGDVRIAETHALVAVDVNSGQRASRGDYASFVRATNENACDAISRFMSLANLSGNVVVDFLTIRRQEDKRAIEDLFEQTLKYYLQRKSNHLPISKLGLLECSIAHKQQSILDKLAKTDSFEMMAIQAIEDLVRQAKANSGATLQLTVTADLENWLKSWSVHWQDELIETIGPRYRISSSGDISSNQWDTGILS